MSLLRLPPVTACLLVLAACGSSSAPPTPGPAPAVEFVTPAATVYASGTVAVQLRLGGGAPDAVELLRDGATLARLTAPYAYAWDTRLETEGPHALRARATAGGQVAESDTVTVVVDRTPPRVAARMPGPGQQDVAAGSVVRVYFDEELLPASVGAAALALTLPGGAGVAGSTLLADGLTLELPLPAVAVPATITASLGAGLTDRAGNPADLAGAASWTFTLPPWVPMGGVLTTPGWGQALAPSLAVDPSGAVWCAHLRASPEAGRPSEEGNVVVQRWSGSTWEQVGPSLDVGPRGGVVEPEIAIDGLGRPVVLWGDATAHHVSRWDGSAWTELGGGGALDYSSRFSSYLATGGGDILVGWSSLGGTFDAVARRWDGAAWQAVGQPITLLAEAAALYQGAPWLAGFWNGSCHAWRFDGQGWTSRGSFPAAAIDVAAGPTSLAVAFGTPVSCPGGSCSAMEVHTWIGSVFVRLGGDPAAGAAPGIVGRSRMRIGPGGRPVLAWYSEVSGRPQVTLSAWDGGAWRPSVLPFAHPANRPALAVDATGVATVASSFIDDASGRIQVLVLRPNGR